MPSSTSRDKADTRDPTGVRCPPRPSRRADDIAEVFAVDGWEPSLLARMRKVMGGRKA